MGPAQKQGHPRTCLCWAALNILTDAPFFFLLTYISWIWYLCNCTWRSDSTCDVMAMSTSLSLNCYWQIKNWGLQSFSSSRPPYPLPQRGRKFQRGGRTGAIGLNHSTTRVFHEHERGCRIMDIQCLKTTCKQVDLDFWKFWGALQVEGWIHRLESGHRAQQPSEIPLKSLKVPQM